MADRLMIVMVNTVPRNAAELGASFFQATVAADMDDDVGIVLTGRSGELAKAGVAANIFVKEGVSKSVYHFIKDAHEAGARFKACTPARDLWGDDLIPEIDEVVGGAYVIRRAMDDSVVTFTY